MRGRGDFGGSGAPGANAADELVLKTAIALRAGEPLPVPLSPDEQLLEGLAQVDDVIELRRGKVPAQDPGACDPSAALRAAVAGDGAPLAGFLAACPDAPPSFATLLAVLPRVTQHRTELAAALRDLRSDQISMPF